jgi:hypothetical protein
MEAGRELDALIAEKVMGWTVELIVNSPCDAFEEWRDAQGWRYGPNPPLYSTDIAAAWEIAEKLQLAVIPDASGGWCAGHALFRGPGWYEENVNDWEHADTAPLALCRAALAAVGAEAG